MPLKALFLIVVSAWLQAALNVPIKNSERKVGFVAGASLVSLVLYFPLLVWGRGLLAERHYPADVWSWIGVAACGVTSALYYIFIGGAYDREDFSLVFPVTRGLGPIFILIFALTLLKERISSLGLLGILITVFGSYVIYLPSFGSSSLLSPVKAFKSKTFLLSMGAGACTAVYALINKRNLRGMEPFTLRYLIFGFMALSLVIFTLLGDGRNHVSLELKHNWRNLLLFGLFDFISAVLVLYALKTSKVSYLGAARNISVVFGVVLGSFLLREGYGKIRFLASTLIFAGVFLLSVS
ncbi:MAG: DMT family transporter [Candidatus Zixiibacteriota bacterium]